MWAVVSMEIKATSGKKEVHGAGISDKLKMNVVISIFKW